MPVLLWQLWQFIVAGALPERTQVRRGVRRRRPRCCSLSGAAIAFWTLPKALEFLQRDRRRDSFAYGYTAEKYLTLIVYMMLAFGVRLRVPDRARLPPARRGDRQHQQLRGFRRYAIVIIFVVAAVITPSADPISLLALAIPMCIFYEISILIGRIRERRRRKRGRSGRDASDRGRTVTPSRRDPRTDGTTSSSTGSRSRRSRPSTAAQSVLVAAPTGSGKTVVAEHAVARALAAGRRAFYTTPIKALSNQKYADLVRRHGAGRVGLLTGDNAINGDAPVVVMTTEVLRNMIYAGSPRSTTCACVVLDEVHYLQDAYRGPVWEEVIIHLPAHVRLVCLSATVSNADELAEWITTVRGPHRDGGRARASGRAGQPLPGRRPALRGAAAGARRSSTAGPTPRVSASTPPSSRRRASSGTSGAGPVAVSRRPGGPRWSTGWSRTSCCPPSTSSSAATGCDDAARGLLDAGRAADHADERARIRAIADAPRRAPVRRRPRRARLRPLAGRPRGRGRRPPRRHGPAVQGGGGGLLRSRAW